MGELIGLFLLYGFGAAGLLILALSAMFSRSLPAVILWGLVGSGLLFGECMILRFFGEVGSATSGNQILYASLKVVATVAFFTAALYFALVPIKVIGK